MGSPFLYFVEGATTESAADLAASPALEPVLGGVDVSSIGTTRGPTESGRPGVVIGPTSSGSALGYYPERQAWGRLRRGRESGGPEVWLGWYCAALPGPEDLRRGDGGLGGLEVDLGDGRTWTVPRAFVLEALEDGTLSRSTTLPGKRTLDDEGRWVPTGVVDRYRRLYDAAVWWWDRFEQLLVVQQDGEGGVSLEGEWNEGELYDRAVDVLSAAYRLERDEASALGILNDQTVYRILSVAIDADSLGLLAADAEKKTADSDRSERSGSTRGGGVSSRDTGRPSLISGSRP